MPAYTTGQRQAADGNLQHPQQATENFETVLSRGGYSDWLQVSLARVLVLVKLLLSVFNQP